MSQKSRVTKLETKAHENEPPKVNPNITAEMWERCINSLADALDIPRGDGLRALEALQK